MPFESARKILANEMSRLQTTSEKLDSQIRATSKELEHLKHEKTELIGQIKETAKALQHLGGPIPDWTDDAQLIAFWDEVKDETQ